MNQQGRFAGTATRIRRELLKSISRGLRIGPASTSFEGLKLKIPLVYGLGADHLSRTSLPWAYHALALLLRNRPGALVDIGANVGLYLIWLKSLDQGREYIGFEPNPACYFYLQELIRCNRFGDASVFPLALADTRGLRTFFARRLGDKMGSLLEYHRLEKEKPYSFDVITEPGDPIFDDLKLTAISAIKVDVEGFEVEVLRGLAGTLARHRPPVVCEVLTPDPDQPKFSAQVEKIGELLSLTRDLDYRIVSVGSDRQLHTASSTEDLLLSSQADRILVPSAELEATLELLRSAGAVPAHSPAPRTP